MATSGTRDRLPDLLRSFALIGIVLVNVEMFSSSKMQGYSDAALADPLSQGAYFLVTALFTFKSFSLFSLMFGAGLGYQIDSAANSGKNANARYWRRMVGLFAIGALHAIFLFMGDILVSYAILGSLLFFCRNLGSRTLVIWGSLLILLQIALLGFAGFAYAIAETTAGENWSQTIADQTQEFAAIDEAFRYGSFWQIAATRFSVWADILGSIFFVQGIAVFGYFLIGLALQKSNLISQSDHRLWKLSRWIALPIGLITGCLGASIFCGVESRQSAEALYGLSLIALGSPFTTFGYVGWIASLSHNDNGLTRPLARAGSASLSGYLLQSVILCIVFLPFGLGLFDKVSAFAAIAIALAAGISGLLVISVWRLKFDRGPLEILLRRWTYSGRQ